MHKPKTRQEYIELVEQALFEVDDLRAAIIGNEKWLVPASQDERRLASRNFPPLPVELADASDLVDLPVPGVKATVGRSTARFCRPDFRRF